MFTVFENKDRIVLVIEYAEGGELYDYINERQGLYEDEARKFFRQITAAVHYLHSVSIHAMPCPDRLFKFRNTE